MTLLNDINPTNTRAHARIRWTHLNYKLVLIIRCLERLLCGCWRVCVWGGAPVRTAVRVVQISDDAVLVGHPFCLSVRLSEAHQGHTQELYSTE